MKLGFDVLADHSAGKPHLIEDWPQIRYVSIQVAVHSSVPAATASCLSRIEEREAPYGAHGLSPHPEDVLSLQGFSHTPSRGSLFSWTSHTEVVSFKVLQRRWESMHTSNREASVPIAMVGVMFKNSQVLRYQCRGLQSTASPVVLSGALRNWGHLSSLILASLTKLRQQPSADAKMKPWTTLFIFFSIASGVFAAKPSADKFQKFQSLSRSGPVDLDNNSFEELTTAPRDYYAAVILTAMDARYGCLMCREFDSEWDLISRSWNKGSKPDGLKMVFATLDFDQGKTVFQKV